MGIEENKKTVRAFFAALERNDVAGMRARMTDDATWWILPGCKFSGLFAKDDYLANIPLLFADAVGDLEMGLREMTAEDDRVAVVVRATCP
jgi:ketosteroid isomerase-like protein